jgi:hypothetical protein
MAAKTILVTGDQGVDYDIYLQSDEDNPPPGTPPTVIHATPGGAGIVYRALRAAQADPAAGGCFEATLAPDQRGDGPSTAAIWSPFDLGDLGATPADQKSKVWRTRRSMSLGRVSGPSVLPRPAPSAPIGDDTTRHAADILVIEDNGGGFRLNVPAWLVEFLEGAEDDLPQHIVLKTCAPLGHGALWWTLAGRQAVADRLVVVVPVADIRRADVRVSQGISWERTAEDLARELASSPALAGLRQARHVMATLHGEGALWMERPADPSAAVRVRLLFDPACLEEEWSRRVGIKGNAYGYHAVFAAALAARLAIDAAAGEDRALASGIERGLAALRALRVLGHGPVKASDPGLPEVQLGKLLAGATTRDVAGADGRIQWPRVTAFGRTDVPAPHGGGSTWRMLEATDRELSGYPLHGKAHRIALLGTSALGNVPYARFAKLFTIDRDEIEALRNLKRLMEAYAEARGETKPLSIAVFGPPGAGKSFGIKQIAETVIEDKRRAFLEFNLSQFNDPADLIGAFHQVRDRVLDGKLPVVFWDEFDSQDYRWLQFLLAPMQDGKFQEGQITHPIGQCVFVFAGATSYTCEGFGPPEQPASESAADRERHHTEVARFRLRKGPDFKSRLHGFLDVFGPNPRQRLSGAKWEDDPADVCYPVRRAVLLRSMLGLMDERNGAKRLDIDPGLLATLLETHYTHGSRSFEKIAVALRQSAGPGYRRSALPSDEVLAMNVGDLAEFKRCLDRNAALQPHTLLLAGATHARWLESADAGNVFRKSFDELPAETRGDNVAAALRIANILALAGLELVPVDDVRPALHGVDKVLENHLETLAEEEHRGWMDVRMKNGWRACARSADSAEKKQQREARTSDCLVPYAELPQEEREKDRDAIRWYPKAAALAGFKIVAKGDMGHPTAG